MLIIVISIVLAELSKVHEYCDAQSYKLITAFVCS